MNSFKSFFRGIVELIFEDTTKPIRAEPKISSPSQCPTCNDNNLQKGKITVHGTILGFLIFSLSHQHCWFQPNDNGEEDIIIESNDFKKGFRCPRCGTVIITRLKTWS